MPGDLEYTGRERFWLWTLAVVGFVGVNGAFLYGALLQPDAMAEAMANPVSIAFMTEAAILVGLLAYLLSKWRVLRLGWGWFVALSFLGSMLFALPVVLLWGRGGAKRAPDSRPAGRAG